MQVPHIPVIPVSYGNAAALLKGVRGAKIPQTWQGGLPFRYHVGPGPVAARIVVHSDSATNAIKHIYDTFGIVQRQRVPERARDHWRASRRVGPRRRRQREWHRQRARGGARSGGRSEEGLAPEAHARLRHVGR